MFEKIITGQAKAHAFRRYCKNLRKVIPYLLQRTL